MTKLSRLLFNLVIVVVLLSQHPYMLSAEEVDKHGTFRSYFDSGFLKSVTEYRKGKLISHQEFDLQGNLREGLNQEFFRTGQVRAVSSLEEGKKDGLVRDYYPTGELRTELNYQKGKLHGETVGYYKNGKQSFVSFYNQGNLNGVNTTYYRNGQLSTRSTLNNGLLDGESLEYYENGNLKSQKVYQMGYLLRDKIYYETGVMKASVIYEDNQMKLSRSFHENGNIKYEMKREPMATVTSSYNMAGNVIHAQVYTVKGYVQILQREYYDTDELKNHYIFENGQLKVQKSYYRNGQLDAEHYYKEGELEVLRSYNESGQLESEIGKSFYKDVIAIRYHFDDNTLWIKGEGTDVGNVFEAQ